MSHSDDTTEPDPNDTDTRKRVSFRDYPSTGLVVLAAAISGLSWLAYKWSNRRRADPSPTNGDTQGADIARPSDHDEASAEPKPKVP